MGRAFLLEPTKADLDLSSAEKYGRIVCLFPNGFTISNAKPEFFRQAVLDKLDELRYNNDTDAIIVAGRLTRIACLTAVLCTQYDRVKLLVYNDGIRGYQPIEFEVPEITT